MRLTLLTPLVPFILAATCSLLHFEPINWLGVSCRDTNRWRWSEQRSSRCHQSRGRAPTDPQPSAGCRLVRPRPTGSQQRRDVCPFRQTMQIIWLQKYIRSLWQCNRLGKWTSHLFSANFKFQLNRPTTRLTFRRTWSRVQFYSEFRVPKFKLVTCVNNRRTLSVESFKMFVEMNETFWTRSSF